MFDAFFPSCTMIIIQQNIVAENVNNSVDGLFLAIVAIVVAVIAVLAVVVARMIRR